MNTKLSPEHISAKRVRELSYFISRQDWTFDDTLDTIAEWIRQRRAGPTADQVSKLLCVLKQPSGRTT